MFGVPWLNPSPVRYPWSDLDSGKSLIKASRRLRSLSMIKVGTFPSSSSRDLQCSDRWCRMNRLTKNGDVNEGFLNSQKPIPLSPAQKENRKEKGFKGSQHSRESYSWYGDLLFDQLFDDWRANFVLVLSSLYKRDLLLKHLRGVDEANPPLILLAGLGHLTLPFLLLSFGNHHNQD